MKLSTLKEQFDRVALKHCTKDGRTPRTIAVLAKGDERYVGISYCHDNDQFSRKMGREIALSRALHRFQVNTGEKLERNPENYIVKGLMDSINSLVFNINNIPDSVTTTVPEHLYLQKVVEQQGA